MKSQPLNQFEDAVDLLSKSILPSELIQYASDAAQQIGFDYCCYLYKERLPTTTLKVGIYSNYPTPWKVKYDKDLHKVDPILKLGMTTNRWLNWSSIPKKKDKKFWSDAERHGILDGISKPTHNVIGYSSIFTLSSSECIDEKFIQQRLKCINLLYITTELAFAQILESKLTDVSKSELTKREKLVLQWIAEGKSNVEISLILDISYQTVNFHIANINRKLNVSNRIEAAVKAAIWGII